MKCPFKVGDWVKCLDDGLTVRLKKDHIYVVQAVIPNIDPNGDWLLRIFKDEAPIYGARRFQRISLGRLMEQGIDYDVQNR